MAKQEIDVRYVANLARIDLSEEEIARLGAQLEGILGYVQQLESLDLEGIEPTAHANPQHTVVRPDQRHDACFTQEQALANAPRQANGQFIVPKVIE